MYEVKMCFYKERGIVEGAAYYEVEAENESSAKMEAFLMAIQDKPEFLAYAGDVVPVRRRMRA